MVFLSDKIAFDIMYSLNITRYLSIFYTKTEIKSSEMDKK